MPYIKQDDRDAIACGCNPETAGELNYSFTMLIKKYLGDSPNYQLFNDAIGALEGCKLELYRRMIASYEDVKIQENGDVYAEFHREVKTAMKAKADRLQRDL